MFSKIEQDKTDKQASKPIKTPQNKNLPQTWDTLTHLP